jgi:hypothetical protein
MIAPTRRLVAHDDAAPASNTALVHFSLKEASSTWIIIRRFISGHEKVSPHGATPDTVDNGGEHARVLRMYVRAEEISTLKQERRLRSQE